MIKHEEIEVVNTVSLPSSVTCNKCGVTTELSGEDYEREWQANEYQSLGCHFGYGSKFDMDTWEFDLCEKCLVDIIRTFKYLPDGYDEKHVDKVYKK